MTRKLITKYEVLDYLKKIHILINKGKINNVFNIYDVENEFGCNNQRLGVILKKAQILGLLNNEGKIKANSSMIKKYSLTTDGIKEVKVMIDSGKND